MLDEPVPNGRIVGEVEELEPVQASEFDEARFMGERFDTPEIVEAISKHLFVDESVVASVIETYVDMIAASIINGYGASIPRLVAFRPTWVSRRTNGAMFCVPSIKPIVDDKIVASMNAKNYSPFFDGQVVTFQDWKNIIPVVSRMKDQITADSIANNVIYVNSDANTVVEKVFSPNGSWGGVRKLQNEHEKSYKKKKEYLQLYSSLGLPDSFASKENLLAD